MTSVLYSTGCPYLHLTDTPDLQYGRFDKISFEYGPLWIVGSPEAFESCSGQLAFESIMLPDGFERTIFQQPTGTQYRREWKIRKTGFPRDNLGKLLFTGKLRSAPRRSAAGILSGNSCSHYWPLTLSINLNPTRYIAHQFVRNPAEVDDGSVPVRLTTVNRHAFPFADNELPLLDEENDNVLIGIGRAGSRYLPSKMPLHVTRYLAAIRDTLTATIGLAAETYGMEVHDTAAQYCLKEVETYWDFASEEPIRDVQNLIIRTRSVTDVQSVRYYKLPQHQFEEVCHSPRLRLALGRDQFLRIYPKTNKRVRFEISTKNAAIGAQRAADIPEVVEKLIDLRASVHSQLSEIFHRLRSFTNDGESPQRLIQHVYAAAENASSGRMLLDQLARSQSVVLLPRDRHMIAVRRLRDRGVLQYGGCRGRRRIYEVTQDYARAAETLRLPLFPQDDAISQ